MREVTIVDYGIGNLLSVARAFEQCGAKVKLSDDAKELERAERLVLPGVGAFKDGMQGLEGRGLDHAVKSFSLTGRPFLGICLGMQMMLDESEEYGACRGLGLIAGNVVSIPATTAQGDPHKIPHIGWNELSVAQGSSWDGTLLSGVAQGTAAYFVHSFTAAPADSGHRLADTFYNGRLISAAIRKGNLYGTQYHPEKSGAAGLKMVQSFLGL